MSLQYISPRVLAGKLDSRNAGAIDWGWQNLVAYGCQNYIVVVDPLSAQVLQTLDEHAARVCTVRWSPEVVHHDLRIPYNVRLASGDVAGNIVIWNVNDAVRVATLTEPGTQHQVLDIKFHPDDPAIVASVHSRTSLILWNVETRTKLWKRDFPEDLQSIHFNPFDSTHVCLSADRGYIYFLRGFSPLVAPTRADRQYRVTGRMTSQQEAAFGNILQMVFSPHTRNVIYFLLPREVIIFDLLIHQTVGSVGLDKERAPFARMMTCRKHPDYLFCLHEDGSLTSWCKKGKEFLYELECEWDLVKQNKTAGLKINAICNGPLFEMKFAAVTADGRLSIWDYKRPEVEGTEPEEAKFSMQGLLQNILSPITNVAVSPYSAPGESLVAVGNEEGTIQIFDMLTSSLVTEYSVHPTAVRGLIWRTFDTVISFSHKATGQTFQNSLSILDLGTGLARQIRKKNEAESSFIRGIRLSRTGRYLATLLKERPIEIWDLETNTLLSIKQTMPFVTTLEWLAPQAADDSPVEQFVFTGVQGSLHHHVIRGNTIKEGNFTQPELGLGVVSALAAKDSLLVSGDTLGTIHCWDYKAEKSQTFVTYRGLVRRIRFSPGENNHQILVLFKDGDFGIWDLDGGVRVSNSMKKDRDFRAVDLDWAAQSFPVVATTDGSLRIMDISLTFTNSHFRRRILAAPMRTPSLLPHQQALYLKGLMAHGLNKWRGSIPLGKIISASSIEGEVFGETDRRNCYGEIVRVDELRPTLEEEVLKHFALVEPGLLKTLLQGSIGTAERSLLSAEYFGDEQEITFWTLALFYMRFYHTCLDKPDPTVTDEPFKPLEAGRSNGHIPREETDVELLNAIPRYFDLLRGRGAVREGELERAQIHAMIAAKRGSYELTQKSAQVHVLLGHREQAAAMLLETRQDSPYFYRDALKACVIASTIGQEAFDRMVSTVARKLIDHINVDEGVELLCLTGKGFEACTELQKHQRWGDSAMLAKSVLAEGECAVVLKEWAHTLIKEDQKARAINILVTLGEFHLVLKFLHQFKAYDQALLFAEALAEFNLLDGKSLERAVGRQHPVELHPDLDRLLGNIRRDYAGYLRDVGNTKASTHFADLAEESGAPGLPSGPDGEAAEERERVMTIAATLDDIDLDDGLVLPDGWAVTHDEEGNRYYYNADTGESSWDPPSRPQKGNNMTPFLFFACLYALPPTLFVVMTQARPFLS
eukprot:TRINITY_DN2283_c0_g1_i2.p1 TRINITY_DN2283_c0_g1~~TRINITY_DN2283_c0_g1_i2.p1  ORF type:complete len:1213 (+),score=258.75 TRINITY_DN2283_c0_g1_i2:59-3697(+)